MPPRSCRSHWCSLPGTNVENSCGSLCLVSATPSAVWSRSGSSRSCRFWVTEVVLAGNFLGDEGPLVADVVVELYEHHLLLDAPLDLGRIGVDVVLVPDFPWCLPFAALFGALAGQSEVAGHAFGDQAPVAQVVLLVQLLEQRVLLLGPYFFETGDH